jgi:F-type H+-transporting ATPase subunit b
MRRTLNLLILALAAFVLTGCVAKYAMGQEPQHGTEPAPAAKSTEAQSEPQSEKKPDAEKRGEHQATAGEAKEGEGEDAEAALKESAMVTKFGSWLGIKDPKIAYWVFTMLNFAILAIAIIVPAKKLLPGMFRSRNASIQKSIEDARKASTEANVRLTSIQERLERLDAEIATIRSTAEEQGRAEEQRLLAATEEEKKKILQSAEQEIAAASASAQRDLKNFAAELAVSLAEKKISVSESADRNLVREFTQSLGNGTRGGKA